MLQPLSEGKAALGVPQEVGSREVALDEISDGTLERWVHVVRIRRLGHESCYVRSRTR
jgi:hypothetical protein